MSKHSNDTLSFMFFSLDAVIKEKLFDEIDSNASNSEIWFDERIYFDENLLEKKLHQTASKHDFFFFSIFSKLWFISNASNVSSNTRGSWSLMNFLMHLCPPLATAFNYFLYKLKKKLSKDRNFISGLDELTSSRLIFRTTTRNIAL